MGFVGLCTFGSTTLAKHGLKNPANTKIGSLIHAAFCVWLGEIAADVADRR